MKYLLMLIVTILFINCSNSIKENELELLKVQNNALKLEIDSILVYQKERVFENVLGEILRNNDSIRYIVESQKYIKYSDSENYLIYSLIMAVEYNNGKAYKDVYTIFVDHYGQELVNDSVYLPLYNFCLFSLAKSYELGVPLGDCKIIRDNITENTIKKSNYYLNKTFN